MLAALHPFIDAGKVKVMSTSSGYPRILLIVTCKYDHVVQSSENVCHDQFRADTIESYSKVPHLEHFEASIQGKH